MTPYPVPPPPPVPARGCLFNLRQAAAFLGRDERFMRRIVSDRVIPFVHVGSRLAFYESDLQAYLDAREVPARTEAS